MAREDADEEGEPEATLPEGEALASLLNELREHLRQGKSDAVAAYDMGLSPAEYALLKRKLYDVETAALKAKTPHELYVDYRLAQQGCLHDLSSLMVQLTKSNQYGSAVGAIKLSSEIQDKIVKMGQELGIIAKAEEKKQVRVTFGADMSVEEIRKKIAGEVRAMGARMKELGSGDMIDVDPGSLYRDAPAATSISTGGKAARYTERRVVKEPGPGA